MNIALPNRSNLERVWYFLRHELIYIAWAGMEASLIGAFCVGLLRWTRFWSAAHLWLFLFCLVLIPLNLSRVQKLLSLPLRMQQRVFIGGLLFFVYLTLQLWLYDGYWFDPRWLGDLVKSIFSAGNQLWFRNIAVIILVAICWLRGLSLAKRVIDIDEMGTRLRFGGLFLAPLAVGIADQYLAVRVAPFVLLYFFALLMAIALTRAEEMSTQNLTHGFAMTPRWFVTVAIAGIFLVLLSAFFGALTGQDNLQTLRSWLGPLWAAIYYAGTTILHTVLYLATPLVALLSFIVDQLFFLIQRLLSSVIGPQDLEAIDLQPITDFAQELVGEDELIAPPNIPFQIGRGAVVLGTFLIITLVIFLSRRLFRARLFVTGRDGEILDGNAGIQLNRGGIRGWFDQIAQMRRRRTAQSIRRIYQDMCLLAAENSYPRGETETPFEYMETVQPLWRESMDEVKLITQAFARIRYGELPETAEELAQIKQAWQTLRKTVISE